MFAYDLHSRLGLYGSVPLVLAHKADRTLGVFWLNASETFVHLEYSSTDIQVVGVLLVQVWSRFLTAGVTALVECLAMKPKTHRIKPCFHISIQHLFSKLSCTNRKPP